MESVARMTRHQQAPVADSGPRPVPERERSLTVAVAYLLSEEGRKASLMTGGNGRVVQRFTIQVPSNRLHLVRVDGRGVARLKLQPRYELDAEQRVVRKDHLPMFDLVPALEDLFREAARNHQLEGAFLAQDHAARTSRREGDRDLRANVARAFLRDPNRRALEYPSPTRQYCFLALESGRHLKFDVSFEFDDAVAREVPPEAYRRFKRDVRARRNAGWQQFLKDTALHDEKARFINEWVADHGTSDQKGQHAAGLLPDEEITQVLAEEAFAPLNDRPLYLKDGVVRFQAYVRQAPPYAKALVRPSELAVISKDAGEATPAQWRVLQEFRALMPNADVRLRAHKLVWRGHPDAPSLMLFGVLVTCKLGPFIASRQYALPEA